MCGIIGYIGNKKTASEIVLNGLKALEYRGYDSWGIALEKSPNDRKIFLKKETGKIQNVKEAIFPKSFFGFGHTRWATHGGVLIKNAHPHLDCSSSLAIIHNGIIENYDELKKELIQIGHKFISETDSEVAAHLVEEYLNISKKQKVEINENILIKAVRKAFNKFKGLNAIIVMDAISRSFIAAKNGSPLVIGKGTNENFLASDAHALLKYTREVYFLDDNEIAFVSENSIKIFSTESERKKMINFSHLNWDISISEKGKYKNFMEKEIFEQPKVIESIINGSDENVKHIADLIKKSFGTYLVGCGTAAYACLAGTYLFSKIAGRHINFAVGSEFGYLIDFLTSKSLVIALSQSGETIDVIDTIKKAKEKNASIGALVNVLGSTLFRIADHKLLLNAGVEKAVVSTKAFTAKLAYLILLSYQLSGSPNTGKKLLKDSIVSLKDVLSKENMIRLKKISKILSTKDHIYIIGRGLSYPIALETALKIKEASYIHAEGFPAGELKHGVIALIEKGTPCIAFLPNDETYGANLAGAMEMKARGGFIIGISYKTHDIFDFYLPYKDCSVASIIPSVVIGQLLGYFLAVIRGFDPDKPRNLAKSVTVK